MEIIEITEKAKYNELILKQPVSQFSQSWEWGEFQKNAGNDVVRLGLEEHDYLVYVLTVIKKSLPFGLNYYYAPHLNLSLLNDEQKILLLDHIVKMATAEKVIFFRFEPTEKLRAPSSELRIIKTIDIQPRKTLIMDLSMPEDRILAAMHQKTRYNIRLAEKRGVTVKEAGIDDFESFWKIMQETRERDDFRLHGKEYYRKMLSIPFIKLLVAIHDKAIIAGNIVAFFGNTATYVHGASSDNIRNVMAPFALQWQAIRNAKSKGMVFYNFYGIDEVKWPGVTRFKSGFGGRIVEFPGAFDLIFNKQRYFVYRILRNLRRRV